MGRNYVIGGGVAGLLVSLIKGYTIIDKNPLGQLNLPFIPGPRILKKDKYVEKLLNDLNIEYHSEIQKIGYKYENQILKDLSYEYALKYSIITRKTNKVEKSFMSSGENEIEILTDGSEDFYSTVFQKIFNLQKDNIIFENITKIDTVEKNLFFENGENIKYDNLISTINFNIFTELACLPLKITQKPNFKHFYKCEYVNPEDIELSKKYSYIYSINGKWTRKTYFKDYIVYEVTDTFNEYLKEMKEALNFVNSSFEIENNTIIKNISAPLQLESSIGINNIANIKMLGRYAEWNHKIKANEILKKLYE